MSNSRGGDIRTYRIGDFEAESRLWAPTAFTPLNECIVGLPDKTAMDVVEESGTQVLIASAPSAFNKVDLEAFRESRIATIEALKNRLGELGRPYVLLNNTARSTSADQAVERALDGSRATGSPYVKLEVFEEVMIEGRLVLVPNNEVVEIATANLLVAASELCVIPYISQEIPLAERLISGYGVTALRAYFGYIGQSTGPINSDEFRKFCDVVHSNYPEVTIVAEGGIGNPEHAKLALELGADAVLVNHAITADPTNAVNAAASFKRAVESVTRHQ